MQLIAFDGQKSVQARLAIKNSAYSCPECRNPLRVRSGPFRQPHFYHISKNSLCRQSGKSPEHLHTQLAIVGQLPSGEAELERPFPELGRIADVVWLPKKIVFEVQCSPISVEEVSKRTFDYESKGFTVIWILHENRYNRKSLSAAEASLLKRDVYFTSYDKRGFGKIYDQFSIVHKNRRLFKGIPLPFSLVSTYSLKNFSFNPKWPRTIQERHLAKRLGFQGDLMDRVCNSAPDEWRAMRQLEAHYLKISHSVKRLKTLLPWIRDVYLSFLHALLEIHSVKK